VLVRGGGEPEENKLWHRGILRENAPWRWLSATQVGDRPATQSNAALVSVPDARLLVSSFVQPPLMYARIISSRLRNFLQHSASSRLGSCTHSTMMYLQRPTDPPPRLDMTMTTLRLTHPPTHARLIPRIEIINDLFGISRNRGVAAGAAAGAARLSDSRDLLSYRCWCVSAGRVPRAQVRILRPTELTHFFLVWWLIVASRFLLSPFGSRTKARSEPRAVVGGFQVR